jgi:hypothetical protein
MIGYMNILGRILSLAGLIWLILGSIGACYPDVLRGIARFIFLGLQGYQRRMLFALGALCSLLLLIELGIFYSQPLSPGDVFIMIAGISGLVYFGLLSGLKQEKLVVSPLVTFWLTRTGLGTLRLLSLVMLLVSWYFFHLSSLY